MRVSSIVLLMEVCERRVSILRGGVCVHRTWLSKLVVLRADNGEVRREEGRRRKNSGSCEEGDLTKTQNKQM